MANYCYNCFNFSSPDKRLVKKFYDDAVKATSDNPSFKHDPEWNHQAVINLFYEKGYTEDEIDQLHEDWRGTIYDVSLSEDQTSVEIQSETAWIPNVCAMAKLAEDYHLEMVYLAEEPGCEIFINSDVSGKIYSTRYRVVFCRDEENDDQEEEYFGTIPEVIDYIANNLDSTSVEVQKAYDQKRLNSLVEDRFPNGAVYIQKYATKLGVFL